MNELEHLEDFQQILANYEVSEPARMVLQKTPLVLCCAVSATGRNTIIRELLKTGDYYFIVTDTTRKPRVNDGVLEQNGVEYWFRNEADMLDDLKKGLFVEAAIIHEQQVSGMSIREVKKAQEQGKIGITDIDIAGVASVVTAKPDAVCLFFLPPSFSEWQRRITSRGEMSQAEHHRRLRSAQKELQTALDRPYYTFVINDVLTEAVAKVSAITADPTHVDRDGQAAARVLAHEILQEITEQLDRSLL